MDLLVFIAFLMRSSADRVFDAMRIDVAGMEMTAGAFLNLGVLGLAGLMTLTRSGTAAFPFRTWLPFVLAATISIAWSPDRVGGIRALLVLLTYVSFFAIPFLVRTATRHSAHLLQAIVYSSIVPVTVGLLERPFFLDQSGRVKSTFMHPNGFALYLMVVVGVIYFLLSSSAVQFKPSLRRLMIPYSGLLVGLIILTQTRAAWAGTFLILVAYAVFVNRRYLVALPLIPFLLIVPVIGDRFADLERGTAYTGSMRSKADAINSFAWRRLMWESAFADVADTPVFGKGLASFAPNSLKFFPLASADKTSYRKGVGAHNAYVQAFYETGAVGLFCYFMIYVSVLLRIARYFKGDPRGSIMLASTVLAYMMANFSDNIFDYGSLNLYFWGYLGIIFAKWAQPRPEFLLSPSQMTYRLRVGDLRAAAKAS
jgi:O-antigen ligase